MRRIILGLLVGLIAATSALADCEPLTLAASLPATRDAAGGVVVPASFEGHDIKLLIDTAGIFSLMSDATVAEFNLERRALPATIFAGASGTRLNESVAVHQFKLANLVANRMEFVVMPAKMVAKGVDGTLGPTVMSGYDMEIDLPHGKVNLFSKHHCTGEVVYWTDAPHAEIPMRVDTALHIIIPVTLDGKTMNAVVDTGSSTSWMDYDDAARIFDWSDAGPPGLAHLGGQGSDWSAYPFAALSLNGVDVRNPRILLKKHSEHLAGGPPLIIGMDVLGKLRTFFSYADHTLYITDANAPPPDPPASAH